MAIDLNADLGEATDAEGRKREAALLELVSSASLACGGHAGDHESMSLALAAAHGVVVGAHPGYPDRSNFGRRELGLAPAAIVDLVVRQTGDLIELAETTGARVRYLKPHGALYHRLAQDEAAASAVARAVVQLPGRLWIVGPPGSRLESACHEVSVPFAREGFLDRAYEATGELVARSEPGAVLDDPVAVASRALAFARGLAIRDRFGRRLAVPADSLCVHGDSPRVVESLGAARAALDKAGIVIRAFAE